MGRFCTFALLFSFFVFSLADDDHGKNAPSYSSDNFESSVTALPHLVMFYAPWCGHCKRLAPTWDTLAEKYNVADGKITVAKVDCTIEKDVCKEQGVTGYPTLKFFNKNPADGERYKGGRDSDALEKFIAEKLGGGKPKEAAAPAEVKQTGPVVTLTGANFDAHIATGKHFIKFYAPWCGHCKRVAPTWVELAEAFKGNDAVTIADVDCTEESSKTVCSGQGVRGYPTLLFFKDGKNEKYAGGRDLPEFKKFINKQIGAEAVEEAVKKESTDGKIPEPVVPEKKVEPVGDIAVYTADSFADGIAKGFTFVKFYAPWCGHCKKMAPAWAQLATELKKSHPGQITIGDVDCTIHREVCSKYDVKGFPTLKSFMDGELQSAYSGGRDLAALKAFAIKNSKAAKKEEKDEL